MAIQAGDVAPDFSLPGQDGATVTLSQLLKTKAVVLYFYPKDETRGCTTQACAFRDSYEAFQAAGAEVVGISSDSSQSHEKFAAHHRLPFVLVSDEGGKVRQQYGVPGAMLGLIAGRVTYVIDRQGVVRHVFNSLVNAGRHIPEALEAVKRAAL